MILSTLVTSQLHFEMCVGLYGHPVYQLLKDGHLKCFNIYHNWKT